MKPLISTTIAILLGSAAFASAETRVFKQSSAEAHAEASSDGDSSVTRKTVTVTSDGEKTIRKTVTVRNGKEEVVTEIIDANGKVTRNGGEAEEKPGESDPADTAGAAWLGVHVRPAPDALRDQLGLASDEGVVVEALAADGPAAKAGIRVNDVLLSLDEARLSDADDLRAELKRREPGASVTLELLRKGQKSTESIVLGEKKDQSGKPRAAGKPDARKDAGPARAEIEIDGAGGHAEAHAEAGDGLDAVLDDPNVPEHFKKSVREMKERAEKMKERAGKIRELMEEDSTETEAQ